MNKDIVTFQVVVSSRKGYWYDKHIGSLVDLDISAKFITMSRSAYVVAKTARNDVLFKEYTEKGLNYRHFWIYVDDCLVADNLTNKMSIGLLKPR